MRSDVQRIYWGRVNENIRVFFSLPLLILGTVPLCAGDGESAVAGSSAAGSGGSSRVVMMGPPATAAHRATAEAASFRP